MLVNLPALGLVVDIISREGHHARLHDACQWSSYTLPKVLLASAKKGSENLIAVTLSRVCSV